MSHGSTIEVLLVDDQPIVREGVRLLLERESDIRVVGEASSLIEATSMEVTPHLIIADLTLRDGVGADVIFGLRDRFPSSRIVILSVVNQPNEVGATFAAGAKGYLLKEAAARELIDAVHKVALGEDYLQPSLGAAIARAQAGPPYMDVPLSQREKEVLRLVALGHTNAEIAEQLALAIRTVEVHRAHVLEKLGLKSRAELVRYARAAGMVELR